MCTTVKKKIIYAFIIYYICIIFDVIIINNAY